MSIHVNAASYKTASGTWDTLRGFHALPHHPAPPTGGTQPVDPGIPSDPNAPLAEWNFTEASAPYKTTAGDLALSAARGNPPRITTPWGYGTTFATSYLRIAPESIGRLNIGARGKSTVTIAVWIRRTNTGTGFLAGCWQEDNNDPRRQYGAFVNLGAFGGLNKGCFHISKTGGPTPGYQFSRDYSATGQTITNGEWQLHVGTYDGTEARSYLNGSFVPVPSFTDSNGNTYSKNPYAFADGLNGQPVEFTVGAVTLTAGPGNYYGGDMAKLRVWDRALSASEISALYESERTVLA